MLSPLDCQCHHHHTLSTVSPDSIIIMTCPFLTKLSHVAQLLLFFFGQVVMCSSLSHSLHVCLYFMCCNDCACNSTLAASYVSCHQCAGSGVHTLRMYLRGHQQPGTWSHAEGGCSSASPACNGQDHLRCCNKSAVTALYIPCWIICFCCL